MKLMGAFCFASPLLSITLTGKTLACLETSHTVGLHDEKETSDIHWTKRLQNL